MDYNKKESTRVSAILGCALLFLMLLLLTLSLWIGTDGNAEGVLFLGTLHAGAFFVPAIWGVWKLRRLQIRFPRMPAKTYLNKRLTVMLSTFGVIMITQIFYTAVFPSIVPRAGVDSVTAPTDVFELFFFSTLIPAIAEEVFFRGFFLRCMRVFRASLGVLMSALVFALMQFSVEGFPMFFVMGLMIGMAYMATNSLMTVIAVRFLCNAFWFLEETVSLYMSSGYLLFMQGGLTVCVLLAAAGLAYLKENMSAFFESDDEMAVPSSCFWTLPVLLFVGLAVGIQLFVPIN